MVVGGELPLVSIPRRSFPGVYSGDVVLPVFGGVLRPALVQVAFMDPPACRIVG